MLYRNAGRGRGRGDMQLGKGPRQASRQSEDSYTSGGWYASYCHTAHIATSASTIQPFYCGVLAI